MRNFGAQLICLWVGAALVAGCSNPEGTATLAAADSGVSAAKSLAAIIASCASATGEVQVRRAGMPY